MVAARCSDDARVLHADLVVRRARFSKHAATMMMDVWAPALAPALRARRTRGSAGRRRRLHEPKMQATG